MGINVIRKILNLQTIVDQFKNTQTKNLQGVIYLILKDSNTEIDFL